MYMYMYMYMYIHVYIYIYIERERERCVYIYIYIHTYILRMYSRMKAWETSWMRLRCSTSHIMAYDTMRCNATSALLISLLTMMLTQMQMLHYAVAQHGTRQYNAISAQSTSYHGVTIKHHVAYELPRNVDSTGLPSGSPLNITYIPLNIWTTTSRGYHGVTIKHHEAYETILSPITRTATYDLRARPQQVVQVCIYIYIYTCYTHVCVYI